MNTARFLIRETRSHRIIRVGVSWGCLQRLFGSQISIHHRYHHLDMYNPLAAKQPSSLFVCYVTTTQSFFSTTSAAAVEKKNSQQQTKEKNNNKKSPHSKLLRVCSDRNANSHFAAIEGTFV